jgi:S1-C subfamily serine protease
LIKGGFSLQAEYAAPAFERGDYLDGGYRIGTKIHMMVCFMRWIATLKIPQAAVVAVIMWAPLHTAARAESWRALGVDSGGISWSIDTESLNKSGNKVSVWVKSAYKTPQYLKELNLYYFFELSRWKVDCDSAIGDVLTSDFLDIDNKSVYYENYENRTPTPIPLTPGTSGAAILSAACNNPGEVQQQGPALSINPNSNINWINSGNTNALRDYVTFDKVSTRKEDIIYYFSKTEFFADQRLNDGRSYRIALEIVAVNCRNNTFLVDLSDYYDSKNQFVESAKADFNNQKFTPIVTNSIASTEKGIICGESTPPTTTSALAPVQSFSGTAWLVPTGYLITANHVVGNLTLIKIYHENKYIGTAEVVTEDPVNDVAILKPKFEVAVHYGIELSGKPALLGENIFTLGYPAPDEMGRSIKLTTGVVSALSGKDVQSQRVDDTRLMQISIPVQPGNSGGPILDERGLAVGIVVSRLQMTSSDEIAQNVNYALKISYVRALLEGLPALENALPSVTPMSVVDAIQREKGAVFLLVASAPSN